MKKIPLMLYDDKEEQFFRGDRISDGTGGTPWQSAYRQETQ